MSETELLGRFETTMGKMQKMLNWASAPFDDRYDQAYFNLAEGELRSIANAGEAVIAYCDFQKPFVRDVELHSEVDESAGMQSILKVPRVESLLDFVGGESLTVEFYGIPGEENRADKMVLDGELRADVFLPSSDSNYESKQLKVVQVYDEDENWIKSNGEPLSTTFTTKASEFNRIIDVVSYDSFALSNYPVVIEDGEFLLDASDENDRDSVYGKLHAEDVEGPDVDNSYSRGFEELFGNISGKLSIGIEDDGPISIVRQSNDDALTLRYSILPAVDS
jgi:hypothetical protein